MSIAQLLMKPVSRTVLDDDASVSLTLGDNPLYSVAVSGLVPETDGVYLARTVNGETADYKTHMSRSVSTDAAYNGFAASSGAVIGETDFGGMGNNTGESLSENLFIPMPSSTSLYKPIFGAGGYVDKGATLRHSTIAGYWSGGVDALTSIELAASADALASGNIDLYQLALHTAADVGRTYGAATLIARTEAAADSEIDFTLSGYRRYALVAVGVVPSADGAHLYSRIATAGGIKTTGCKYHTNSSKSDASTYLGTASASTSILSQGQALGNVGGESASAIFEIPNPAGLHKIVSSQGAFINSGGNATMMNGAGAYTTDTDQLATFRVLPSSGTITSGLFLLYGIDPE